MVQVIKTAKGWLVLSPVNRFEPEQVSGLPVMVLSGNGNGNRGFNPVLCDCVAAVEAIDVTKLWKARLRKC
jgi:hypothetical protein